MFSLVTTAFLLAGASITEPATPSAAPASATGSAAAATPPAKEKKVCRREQLIGSIMPTRTCRTQSEWAAIDRAAQSATDAQLRDYRSRHSE